MIETIPRSNASLPELLAQRARHASDGRLAFDVAGGIIVATIAAILTPPGWLQLFSAALTFASFGAWGICDRMLSERSLPGAPERDARDHWLRAARLAAAALGACAAVVLLFSVFALMLGTWIS
ncbi:MAG TPA: hypothetical protein VFW89_08735 [Gemmatimonadaceae bacterium]|nr:hypothetical protein [Gemmatimonadaceae bacterium]